MSGRTREERRALEATFPKCPCGATLGLERSKAGVKECRRCLPDDKLNGTDTLSLLQNQARSIASARDASDVLVQLIQHLKETGRQ